MVGAPAATDTTQPTQLQKGIVLASPGVVFITAHVVGRVTGASTTQYKGEQKTFTSDAAGSGFVVNPNGTVVTASHVIDPDYASMRYFGANYLFGALDYLDKYNLPEDEPLPRSVVNAENLSSSWYQNLQNCYKGIDCKFEFPRSQEVVKVYTAADVAGVQLGKPAVARVLKSTGFNNTDVGVLQIDEQGLPTVPIVKSAGELQQGANLEAIGFPGTTEIFPRESPSPRSRRRR